ncbi:MAG: PorT family protein [Saprospiraceae bacterium]|nr:PorT family protein [Saprospiraceae bacterium]
MRTFSILLMFSLLFCFSQQLEAQRFKAGIVAGINLSQLDGDDLVGYNRIGINAGGKVAAVLTDRLELGMELLYSQKGSNRSRTDNFNSTFDEIRLNYVEVPVMLSFTDWKFQVNGGFSYARLIDYRVEDFLEGDVTESFEYNQNIFSIVVGATYFFRENFGLNLRWTQSVSDLQGIDGGNTIRDRTIGLRLLYLL